MDLSIIMPWVGAILAFIALGTQVKAFFGSGEKKLEERMEKTEKTLVDHDRRVQRVEDALPHLPSKDSVHELKLAIVEMAGKMSTQSETLGSVSRTVHRIDDYLRQEGKG